MNQDITVARSKTEAGHRLIPLNSDATAALCRLKERAEFHGAAEADDFVFPACERGIIDRTRPQKSWRTAWRALVKETARKIGRIERVVYIVEEFVATGARSPSVAWEEV